MKKSSIRLYQHVYCMKESNPKSETIYNICSYCIKEKSKKYRKCQFSLKISLKCDVKKFFFLIWGYFRTFDRKL